MATGKWSISSNCNKIRKRHRVMTLHLSHQLNKHGHVRSSHPIKTTNLCLSCSCFSLVSTSPVWSSVFCFPDFEFDFFFIFLPLLAPWSSDISRKLCSTKPMCFTSVRSQHHVKYAKIAICFGWSANPHVFLLVWVDAWYHKDYLFREYLAN